MLSDHGDAVEDDVDVNEFSEEATGVMPPATTCLLVHEDRDFQAYRDVLHEVSETLQGDWKHEQYDFFAASGSWRTKRTKVCTQCENETKSIHMSEGGWLVLKLSTNDCAIFLDQNRPTHPDGDKDDQ